MEKTTNYKLFKPELGDRVSIGDINENMDILDEKLKEVETVKIDKSRILTTREEVEAVTEEGFLVDALVAAQLNSDNSRWGTRQTVTLPYTPTQDGVLQVIFQMSDAAEAYIYISDGSDIILSISGSNLGGRNSRSVPAIAGKTYAVLSIQGTWVNTIYFYPFK